MKRIFIAIPASAELREHIAEFVISHTDLPVRWLAPENLHITLVPPVEVTDAELEQVIAQLGQVPRQQPFPISFHNVSFGSQPTAPRLIWANGEAPTQILQLKQNIESVVRYRPDRPNFKMHLTIARFKETDFANFPIKNLDEAVHWKMLVEEFVLMESIRMPDGARYPILHQFPLS